MSIDYTLTIETESSAEDVLGLVFPDESTRPGYLPSGIAQCADVRESRGFLLYAASGSDGYVEGVPYGSTEASWEWEPAQYVRLTFVLDMEFPHAEAVRNVREAVRLVLEGLSGDAALDLNCGVLLLRRQSGVLEAFDGNSPRATPDVAVAADEVAR
jgi:hypothetical protein